MKSHHLICFLLGLALSSCMSRYDQAQGDNTRQRIRTIAVSPHCGAMSQPLTSALLENGYMVVDQSQIVAFFKTANLAESTVLEPRNIAKLRDIGIDAYLIVREADGADGLPLVASVTVISTMNGELVLAGLWQKGHRDIRTNHEDAARQIVKSIVYPLTDLQARE